MRKILQLFLSLSLMLLLLPPAVQAQERTITGTILSEDNKTPLSGVTVRVKVPDASFKRMRKENSVSK